MSTPPPIPQPVVPFDEVIVPNTPWRFVICLVAAAIVVLLANLVSYHFAASLRFVPPGTAIRPMFETTIVGLSGFVGACVNVVLSIIAVAESRYHPHRWIVWVPSLALIAGALLATKVGSYTMDRIIETNNLMLKP